MSGLSTEDRADLQAHQMTRRTEAKGGFNRHRRECVECGVHLPWDGWEAALRLHIVDVVEDLVDRHVTAALTDAADAIEARRDDYIRVGGEADYFSADVTATERAGYLSGLTSAIHRLRAAIPTDSVTASSATAPG